MKDISSIKKKFDNSTIKVLFVGLFFLLTGIIGVFLWLEGEEINETSSILALVQFIKICAPPLTNALIGLLFLIGGYGCLKYKEWGRKSVVFVLLMLRIYCFGYTVYFLVGIYQEDAILDSLLLGTMALIISAFWIYILHIPFKYFRSVDVREICN
jgi:hypothetical protein